MVIEGTAAIHMALKYLGVGKGNMVLCSDLTFAATCNPILYQGGIPIFIDSERESWNMNPVLLERALQQFPKTKAVIVVNLYGTPAKLSEIGEICEKYQVPWIEDAAESLGAFYRGKATGSYGKYGVFSFNGNKIITTSGGGMLVSEEKHIITSIRI